MKMMSNLRMHYIRYLINFITNWIMCCNTERNQVLSKSGFQQTLKKRQQFTKDNNISQFLICVLQFMEETLKINKSSRPPSFKWEKQFNVEHNFIKTYYQLSAKQQLKYYQQILDVLMDSKTPEFQELQKKGFEFEFKINESGFVLGNKQEIIKIEGKRFLMVKDDQQFDLRNYWIRQSKSHKKTYDLLALGNSYPYKYRFTIKQTSQKYHKVVEKMQYILSQAVIQLANRWYKPIKPIQLKTTTSIQSKVHSNVRKNSNILSPDKDQKKPKEVHRKKNKPVYQKQDKSVSISQQPGFLNINNKIMPDMEISQINHQSNEPKNIFMGTNQNKRQDIKIEELLVMSREQSENNEDGNDNQQNQNNKNTKEGQQINKSPLIRLFAPLSPIAKKEKSGGKQSIKQQIISPSELSLSEFGNLSECTSTQGNNNTQFYSMDKSYSNAV